MTTYSKETVATLRQLLKDRSIPSTGLTRKAQIVEKLEEWDSDNAPQLDETGEAAGTSTVSMYNSVGLANVDAEAVIEQASDEIPKLDDQATEAKSSAAEGPETTTSAPDVVQPIVETPEAAETRAPESMEPTIVPEAQNETGADNSLMKSPQPASETAEQAQIPTDSHATDFARANVTPSPSPDEKPSIEKPELLPIPERSTTTTTDPSRLNTEELEADTRKRKRRSLTPELSAQEVRAKKPRPSEDAVHGIAPVVDEDTVMDQPPPEEALEEPSETQKEISTRVLGEEATKEHQQADSKEPDTDVHIPPPRHSPTPPVRAEIQSKKNDRHHDALKTASSTPKNEPEDLPEDDRSVSPALHPATPALYIRNFMRPLRPDQLQTHLVSLASPPGTDPDPKVVVRLYIDNIRTHAFVRFATTTAASRVRASLHDTIWPPEGNRKALWVDFVPDTSCARWIDVEEAGHTAEREARKEGLPIPANKFEVVYLPQEDGSSYKAVFQEVGAGAAAFNPPKGPRRGSQQVLPTPTLQDVPQETRQTAEQSFKTLDELFSSTTAKPKLYFLAVSDERADARRQDLKLETSRDWEPEEKRKGRGIQASHLDQKLRFTFDDKDRVVEAGGDFGPWAAPSNFAPRGRGGAGYRGRGRGGGWRSGP